MKKKGIIAIVLVVIIVGGGIGGFFLIKKWIDNGGTNGGFTDDRPCVSYPFTHFPVDLDGITGITPLGNLNPPGHTFPTDHMYFYPNTTSHPDGFEIYSPGEIIITEMRKIEYDPPHGGIAEDFSLSFSVCEYVSGTFGHIVNLSSFLLSQIDEFGEEYGDTVNTWEVAGDHYTSYNKRLELSLDGGVSLGIAGLAGAYDFWLKDTRINLQWVNQEWTQEFQHTVSPLLYYNITLRNTMETMLTKWGSVPTDPIGYHGKIDFDVADRAQGIWVKHDWSNRAEDYGLSLVYSNFNSSEGAISVGIADNSSWDSSVYTFTPSNSGFRNRNFSQVLSDGNVYYYFCDQFESGSGYTKVILLKMTNSREILVQYIDNGVIDLPSDPSSLFNSDYTTHYVR